MNTNWSLDKIYKGFDDPKFINDLQTLDTLINEFNNYVNHLNKDVVTTLKDLLTYTIKINALIYNISVFAELKQSVNTQDSKAISISDLIANKASDVSVADTKMIAYIASIEDMDTYIQQDALLKEHAYYLHNIKEIAKHTLSPEVEQVISLYEISGSNAWESLQGYLTSNVKVEYEDKILTLSDVRNLAYDPSSAIRKKAYEAELKAYDQIKDGIAFSLNSIKLEVINRCKLKGYDSPLDEALKNAHMKQETLDALLSAMDTCLPKFWDYLKVKGQVLGYENGLPWYEMFAPLKGNQKTFTIEEARDYLVSLFSTFDTEEANMMQKAFDENWIDFYPKEGKVGGAFCAGVPSIKESRVLTNFDGTFSSIVTLAHELGHGFHDYCLRNNSILNMDVSMPVAETASTFNEVVLVSKAIEDENDVDTKRAFIENQLMDATQIICDIYSRYLFEKEVFERRKDEFLFADDLNEIMLDTQKKAYGYGLDENILHPYMWACKSHYYSGDLSFYNFPYAFGGLFARGLYAKYLEDKESFVPLYKKLLKETGTNSVEDAAKIANIDLTDKNFWLSALKILTDEIDTFIELCK